MGFRRFLLRLSPPWPAGFGLLGFCLALFVLLPRAAFAVLPAIRQILVVDSQADPLNLDPPYANPHGAIFFVGYGAPYVRIASTHRGMVDPVATAELPDRRLVVADASADPLQIGRDTGALWVVDPADPYPGDARLGAASALFRAPADVLVEADGKVLLLDSSADPHGWGTHRGAVFRVDPGTHGFDLVTASALFSRPRCLAWDLDGTVLILDPGANPQALASPAGAIFRMNPLSGAVSVAYALAQPPFRSISAVAVIPDGPHRGDLLVVDKDADPDGRGNNPGAVFRIPHDGGTPVLFSDYEGFVEPIDILCGAGGDVLVLDRLANPLGSQRGHGAVFRFDRETGAYIEHWASAYFQDLAGLTQREGATLDSSAVSWTDESQGLLQPGDFMTVRARLRNSGNRDTQASAVDTLSSSWSFLAGSDSAGSGTTGFDPSTRVFSWRGDLAQGDSADLRFRIRLSDGAGIGDRVEQRLTAYAGLAPSIFRYFAVPSREFDPGTRLFVDITLQGGVETGVLYRVNPDALTPTPLWSGPPLQRPSDVAFLDDGSAVILDGSATAGSAGAILHFRPNASSGNVMTTLFAMQQENGFVEPSGIAVDRDGSLLIIDRDANPYGYEPPDDRCGAVFRLDPNTLALSVVMSFPRWRQPLDAVVDRRGHILVIDPGAVVTDPAVLWEIVPGESAPIARTLPAALFRDPTGLCLDRNDNLYITDPNSPVVAGRGSLLYASRTGDSYSYRPASTDVLLSEPIDCALGPEGGVLVADREANPNHFVGGDHGAVFRYDPILGRLQVSSSIYALRQPDGPAVLGVPDVSTSYLRVSAPATNPQSGDTLEIQVGLVNSGTRAITQALGTVLLTPTLGIESGSAQEGRLDLDIRGGQASWSGRIPAGDTARFVLRTRVLDDLRYGLMAGAELTLYGGSSPLTLSRSLRIRAPFAPGDLILADQSSNPNHLAPSPGALFRLDDAGNPARLVISQQGLFQPSAVEWSPAGDLIVATREGSRPGALFRFNATQGYPEQLAVPDSTVRTPVDLLYSPQGDLLLVDRDTPGPVFGSHGGLFRLDPVFFRLRLFASDSLFRAPTQAAFGPDGHLYVVDAQADPGHLGGDTGAIFTLDEHTGRILAAFQTPSLLDPTGIVAWDDSTLLVTDQGTRGQYRGALLYYRPRSGNLELAATSVSFRSPWRSTRLPTGELLIIDVGASAPGQTGHGVVFGFDLGHHFLRYYAESDSFLSLADLAQKPGPLLQFVRFEASDVNGPPLHPADRVELRAVLRNQGPVVAAQAAWADTVPAEASLLPQTAEASTGALVADSPNSLSWVGDVEPGDSVVIRFQVQLNPALSEGRLLEFPAFLRAPLTGLSSRTASIPTYAPFQPGFLYLADASAMPFGNTGGRGAILKVNLITGSVVPMYASPMFRHPRSIALTGLENPRFLILDDQYTPPSGRGGLFLFDPVTQDLTLVGYHESWISPRKVIAVKENEALVLDSTADPFHLTSGVGPGALYRVDLDNRTTTPIFSDTTLVSPSSMTILPSGLLAIGDSDADPNNYGSRNGAVFTLDLDSLRLHLFATSPAWRDPVAITCRSNGSVVLLDQTAVGPTSGRGTLWNISPEGQPASPIGCSQFVRVTDVQIGAHGYPIVCDLDSDPLGLGRSYGAIFQWDPAGRGNMYPLAASTLFDSPISFFLYRDLTPAGDLVAQTEVSDDGILLRWQAPPAETGVHFLLYRRAASGPEDPGDATPAGYDLIASDRVFAGPGPHEYLDADCAAAAWYVYLIADVDAGGAVTYSAPVVVRSPATLLRLDLRPALPNPFRDATTVTYVIPAPGGEMELAVYDVSGRRVRLLDRGQRPSGRYVLQWDGRDDGGHPVANGLYFARLGFGRQVRTGRIVRVR